MENKNKKKGILYSLITLILLFIAVGTIYFGYVIAGGSITNKVSAEEIVK